VIFLCNCGFRLIVLSRGSNLVCSGVKSVQSEAFNAVAAEERSLSRDLSEAAQMVAAIESGDFTGGDRDPLDCDSISGDEEGASSHRPSTSTSRNRPKSSGQTELPIEVSCICSTCLERVLYTSSRYTLLINYCVKLAASLQYPILNNPTTWSSRFCRDGILAITIGKGVILHSSMHLIHCFRFLRVRSQCSNELCVACIQSSPCLSLLCCATHLSQICPLILSLRETIFMPCNMPFYVPHVTRCSFLLVDRVAAELPHMSRAEIEEHEDW
jgi:hypothetical protein